MTAMTHALEDLAGAPLVAALEKQFDTVIEDVPVADRTFTILRPRKSDDLIKEEDFVKDERLPYWADIWPASIILAEQILTRRGHGRRLLELGCGIGLVTTAAMASAHEVLASDYYTDALAFTRANAFQNLGKSPTVRMMNWRNFPADAKDFDKVIASDVLYEGEYAKLLPRVLMGALSLHGVALIADPGRIAAPEFLEKCESVGLELLGKETFPFEAGEIKQKIDIYELGRTR
jgi:predicted nicotinamide N-methyase